MRNLILLLATFLISAHAWSQQFWGKTQYGMTASEVNALFGNKLKSEHQEEPKSLLTMQTSLCEATFGVQFAFASNKLLGVVLISDPDHTASVTGDCIFSEYVGAFGKPESSKRTLLGSETIFWRENTVVNLTIWTLSKTVIIRYGLRRTDL